MESQSFCRRASPSTLIAFINWLVLVSNINFMIVLSFGSNVIDLLFISSQPIRKPSSREEARSTASIFAEMYVFSLVPFLFLSMCVCI